MAANTGTYKGTDILISAYSPNWMTILNRVQGFGFDPSWDTEQHKQYGNRTPIEIIKTYNGVSGSVDLEVVADPLSAAYAHTSFLAIMTDQDPDPAGTTLAFDPADFGKFDLVANVFNEDPEDYTTSIIKSSYFVKQAEISGSPYDSSIDGAATRTVDFDATTGIEAMCAITSCTYVVPIAGLAANAPVDFDPASIATDAMDHIYNSKRRGTSAGHENQIEPLTAPGATALVAKMNSWKGKYHLYAFYVRAGVYKELVNATSTASQFLTGEALIQNDVLTVFIMFDDHSTIL